MEEDETKCAEDARTEFADESDNMSLDTLFEATHKQQRDPQEFGQTILKQHERFPWLKDVSCRYIFILIEYFYAF